MNTELIMVIVSIVLALLAAAVGYLVAQAKGKKAQADKGDALVAAKAELSQLQQQAAQQGQKLEGITEQHRSQELELKQTDTQLKFAEERKAELTEELQQANSKTEAQTQLARNAEKTTEATKAELKENREQQAGLNTRLSESAESVSSLREQLEAQRQSTADQVEKAKEFEVKAEEALKNTDELQQRYTASEETITGLRSQLTKQTQTSAGHEKQAKEFEVKAEEAVKNAGELKVSQLELTNKYDTLQEKFTSLTSEYMELKTSLDEREASHKREVATFDKQKEDLKTEFKVVSEEIIEQRQKALAEQNKEGVGALLKPLQEQLNSFQQRVNDVHTESVKGNTALESEIKKVLDVGLKMRDEASNLTSALKGDSQKRGAWGEAQLERTLEMSGLIQDAHYEKQSSFKDADGKQKQTDYLIKLPDNKHMIIDSKVSLIAYDKAVSAESPEAEALALAEHVAAVKKHITDLASKDYTNLIGMHSPSFVLMFMPIEPAYIEALKNNKDLFNFGYERGIVLVSHTTLIPILRTVANLWMVERSNQEAREISDKAGDIYNQVCTVAERLLKVGTSLKAASNNYNHTVKSLVGQQGLHGKVERFNQLSSKVSKTLPALEPSHNDIETERLALIAEPITDESSVDELTAIESNPYQSNTAEPTALDQQPIETEET